MSKEVTVKQQNQVALSREELVNEWGVPTVQSQDLVVPKILPMQGLSKLVVDRKAQIGDFRDSMNGKLLGSIDKQMEFIPFYLQKVWDIQEQQGDGSYKYARTIPLVEDPISKDYNDNLPWEGEGTDKDGKTVRVKRIRRMNFFVLLPEDVKNGTAFPYVLSFKSTSLKEGKKLYSQMYVRNLRAGLPPAAMLATMGGIMQTNQKGSFVVPSVSFGRNATQEELTECLSWLKMVRKSNVKIEEGDEATVVEETGDASGTGEY